MISSKENGGGSHGVQTCNFYISVSVLDRRSRTYVWQYRFLDSFRNSCSYRQVAGAERRSFTRPGRASATLCSHQPILLLCRVLEPVTVVTPELSPTDMESHERTFGVYKDQKRDADAMVTRDLTNWAAPDSQTCALQQSLSRQASNEYKVTVQSRKYFIEHLVTADWTGIIMLMSLHNIIEGTSLFFDKNVVMPVGFLFRHSILDCGGPHGIFISHSGKHSTSKQNKRHRLVGVAFLNL